MTRGEKAGVKMADALVEWVHMMYQKATARRVLCALIERLSRRMGEFDE